MKAKFVKGTVVSDDVTTSRVGRGAATLLIIDYEIGVSTIKRCQLNSRGIKMAEAESTTGESNEPVTALLANEIAEHMNETISVGAPFVASMTTQELLGLVCSLDKIRFPDRWKSDKLHLSVRNNLICQTRETVRKSAAVAHGVHDINSQVLALAVISSGVHSLM